MKSPLKTSVHFKSVGVLKSKLKASSNISSFLLYDGHVEVALAEGGHTIIAHTNKKAVYEFWATLLSDPRTLGEAVAHLFPTLSEEQFQMLQENWSHSRTPLTRATLFFILNRCSNTGHVSQGVIDMSRFNPISVSKLKNFQIEGFYPFYDDCEDVFEGLAAATHTDYIVIPAGKYSMNLFEYGKNRGPDTSLIHHRNLREKMGKIKKNWALLYKKHPALFNLYDNYDITMVDEYGQPTTQKSRCEELIIANF